MFNKRSRMAAIIAVCSVMVFFGAISAVHAITNIGTITVDAPRGAPEPPAIPVQNACIIEDSIALHTGEFVWSLTDLALPGRGPDLVISHMYKSGSNIRGRWGRGWHLSVDVRVLELKNGNLLLVDGDGRKHEFQKKTDGSGYTPPAGVFDRLVETGDGGFARITLAGDRHEFDQDGKLTRMENRNGKGWAFSYADSNKANMSVTGTSDFSVNSALLARTHKLETITDEAGREIRFFYNNNGRLNRITGPDDRETTYAYDERGRLTHIHLPPPLPDAGAGETDAYQFAYAAGTSRLVEVTDPAGIGIIENDYDDQGRVQEQTHRGRTLTFAYDRENQATTVTRPNGAVDEYVFNDQGNPTRIVRDKGDERLNLDAGYIYDDATNMTKKVDPSGIQTRYNYDETGNLTTITQNQGGSESIATTYDYENGRISKIIDPLGRETSFSYDNIGNLKEIRCPSGEKIAFEYNDEGEKGDLLKIIETAADGDAHNTSFSYDARGYLSAITDRMNKSAALAHNDLGQIETFTDRDGVKYLYEHDLRGRLLRKSIQLTDSEMPMAEFEYEKNGKLKRITTPNDDSISYGYDTNGRLERIHGPNRPDTQYAYDDAGNLHTVTHDDDLVLWFSYDALDRLIRMSHEIQYVGPNPDNLYAYDANGNLTSFEDARSNKTEFDYDAYNQLTQTTYPDGKTETCGYNAAGNLISVVNRAGKAFDYEYDEANRLKKESVGDHVVEYEYNNFGLLDSATIKEGDAGSVVVAVDYEYNALGRLESVRQGDYTVGYEYTPEGKPTKLKYPKDYEIECIYNGAGRLETIKDVDGLIASFDYKGAGRMSRKEMGIDGLVQTYTWNGAGRMVGIEVTRDSDDAAISTTTYAYDALGNLKTANGPLGQFEYGYDPLNRLVAAGYTGALALGDAEYQYDWVGNRTKVIQGGGSTGYSLPENSNCYGAAGGTTSLGCDANGNLEKDSLNHYTYDQKNRLIKVDAGDIEVRYAYDHEGRLIRRRQSDTVGEEITYVYDADRMIAEYDADGNILRRYVYHPENGNVIRMSVIGQAKYYFLTDRNGSVVAIADEAGEIMEQYAYDAFGNFVIRNANGEAIETSAVGNPFYFAGKRFDETTGLYIDGCRQYHPGLGRYLQPDPDGYDMAGNSYTYMNNNPFNENILPPPPSAPSPESTSPAEEMIRNLFSDPFVTVDPTLPRPRPAIHYTDPNRSNVWAPPEAGTTIPYLIQMPPMGR